jgi:hypothetical protein
MAGNDMPARDGRQTQERRSVPVQLEGFAAEAIDQEAKRLGVSFEDLVNFSVLYYLADVDSGRIARQIVTSPYSDGDGDDPDGDCDLSDDSPEREPLA